MDFAKCNLNGEVYGAYNFSKLSDAEISNKRKHLICNECGAKAYFKKKSKSGQAACFGAKPHNHGCGLATEENENCLGTLESDEKELINTGNLINVDFDFTAKIVTHIDNNCVDSSSYKATGSKHVSSNGVGRAESTRKLKSLLNMLVNDQNFAYSTQKINIGHTHPYNAKTIFREFSSISDADINHIRGVYGQIFDVNMLKSDLWINSGGHDECSILIEEDIQNDFFNRFPQYNEIEDLNGMYVLCFGTISKSKNDKFFIKLDDISKIVFK